MRKGFTLIEMLVVMAIAMIILGMAAAGYRNVKKGQTLISGATSVESTLQSARSQAIQLGQVVSVYFLDGGQYEYNYDGDSPTNYLMALTAFEVPYELRVITKSGQELSRVQLPETIGWMSLGNGCRGFMSSATDTNKSDDQDWDNATYKNSYTVYKKNIKAIGRNCSLIINFSPAGNAWADIAPLRDSKDSEHNIRVFTLDDIDNSSSMLRTATDTGNFPYSGSSEPNKAIIAKTFWLEDGNYSDKDDLIKDQKVWFTIKWNESTGLCELIHGHKE